MTNRIYNFNAGPSTLPEAVLKQAQEELLDFQGTGMSIMEISHRSPEFAQLNSNVTQSLRELMNLPENYKVMLVGGGASSQFAMIPMNFLSEGDTASYVDTGTWSSKAMQEAKLFGNVHLAASSKDKKYCHIPSVSEFDYPADSKYLHLTSNNTVYGTQYHSWPETGATPLVCDMSSDILSRSLDFKQFSVIYAGAQKNLGPAGVTIVIMREDMLDRCSDGNPTMFDYRTHAKADSLYNTPPVFAIYLVNLTLNWIKERGGLKSVEQTNIAKKERIYQMIDLYPDYYRGTVETESRSWMNLIFRLPTEELEKKFIAEAKEAGMGGLKGHRSVGGVRVSLYNAMTLEGADTLAGFMEEFKKKN